MSSALAIKGYLGPRRRSLYSMAASGGAPCHKATLISLRFKHIPRAGLSKRQQPFQTTPALATIRRQPPKLPRILRRYRVGLAAPFGNSLEMPGHGLPGEAS